MILLISEHTPETYRIITEHPKEEISVNQGTTIQQEKFIKEGLVSCE